MLEKYIPVLLSTLVLMGAAAAYIHPLRKREKWQLWLPPMVLLNLLCMGLNYHWGEALWAAGQLLQYCCLVFLVNRCTKLSFGADMYCAVWILVTGEGIQEVWLGVQALLPKLHETPAAQGISVLLFSALCFWLICCTTARWMPEGDIYQIGPRQLISAILLGALCIFLSRYLLTSQQIGFGKALVFALCQMYCISLMYIQTELFKKSKLEKDLETLNLLYNMGAQQFAAARQNVQAVNRKCQELEQVIARMEQQLPAAALEESKASMDQALRACDTMVRSGNGVLDIVLTEKTLLAESYGIQLSCVADGKLLDFMEVVDIYALFSNALDNAIAAVRRLPDKNHRIIDLLVHENQNFVVVNISNPVKDAVPSEEELPSQARSRSFRGYGLRVMRHVVEKYHGICSFQAKGGFFTLKALIPLSQKEK